MGGWRALWHSTEAECTRITVSSFDNGSHPWIVLLSVAAAILVALLSWLFIFKSKISKKDQHITLKNARSALFPARAKWKDIGIELDIDIGTLDSIERSCHFQVNDCLPRMLDDWFKRTGSPPSWDALIKVLESDPVGERHLAEKIKQKYYCTPSESKSECVPPPHTVTGGDSQAEARTKHKDSPQEKDDDDDILGESKSECVPPPHTVTAGDSQAEARTKCKDSPQEKDDDDDDILGESKSECVPPPLTVTAGDSQAEARTNSPQEKDDNDDDILGGSSKSECVPPPHTVTAGDSQAEARTKCKDSPQEKDDDDDILGESRSECVPPPLTVTAGDSQAEARTKQKSSPQEKDDDDDDEDDITFYGSGYDYRSGRSWASRDTQRYRSGYRDTNGRDDLRLDRNYKFYTNQLRSEPNGDLIENIHDLWKGNYSHLEAHRGYIQWLFPIRERGSNWHAQELQPHEIERICDDPVAHKRILTSYELMLDFYGMKLKDPETGEIERAGNWMARFRHLNRSMHNYLRITRILKCLGEFGYEHLKAPFVRFILHEAIVERTLDNTIDSCLNYWLEVIKDDKERKQIKKYARELQGT